MVDVTSAIVGPGILEEYADLTLRANFLLGALRRRGCVGSNDTPEGRIIIQLQWLKRETMLRNLPIPLHSSYYASIAYYVGEGSLDYTPEIARAMAEIVIILSGQGLFKARHRQTIVAMINEFLAAVAQHVDAAQLSEAEQRCVRDLSAVCRAIAAGNTTPPIPRDSCPDLAYPRNLTGMTSAIPNGGNLLRRIAMVLEDGSRPYPARKPPMSALNAGLPPVARDVSAELAAVQARRTD